MSGRSVGKMLIIILSFKVGIPNNKKDDHRVKETCSITHLKIKTVIIVLKKLVLLCQYKLHMKATVSLYSVIQQCQMY